MSDDMTQAELVLFLETLADLIQATAKTPEDAAQLVRDKADKLK